MSQNDIFTINMTRKKKEDFAAYVTNVLQNSMLTGIPQIATAGNWPKRLVRTFVFFMCVAGFIYQSMSFMNVYWEYDVVMDVKIENPDYAVKPSFTICNPVGFKVQEFCKDKDEPEKRKIIVEYEAWCFKIEDLQTAYRNFCICNPRLCDFKGNLKYKYSMEFSRIPEMPLDLRKKWLLTPGEIMEFCQNMKMEGEDPSLYCSDKYFIQPGCQLYGDQPESCVTVNSLIGRPNHTLKEVSTDSGIYVLLNIHDENYPESTMDPYSRISIHNPYSIINPLKYGYTLERGKKYNIRLKKVIQKLLPPPYKTNCLDYRSLWHARGGRGPTNLKECIQECQLNLSLAKHGCVMDDIYAPSDEPRCSVMVEDHTLFSEAKTCIAENCRPACYEEYYTIEKDSVNSVWPECSDHHKDNPEQTSVAIELNGMETTIYTYSPKYQDIETFSYLGGYVGMWLGISLVAVFDFVETMVVMLKYPWRRWTRFKEKRTKIQEVKNLQFKH